VHPPRPQRPAVDEPGVGLHQRGAGLQPLPGVVGSLDPAGRDEHQPVPGPGPQAAEHRERTGPQRRPGQAARPGRRDLGRRAGQSLPGHRGVGRDDPVKTELDGQVRDRVHVRVGQVRRDLDQQRHAPPPARCIQRRTHRHQHRPQPAGRLQVTQPWRVRRADVDHHVVRHPGHRPRAGRVVGRGLGFRHHARLADIHPDYGTLPTRIPQLSRRRGGPGVIEPHPVDQRPVRGQPEQPRLGVPRLGLRGHRADLHEPEPQRGQPARPERVLVEPCRQPERAGKLQPQRPHPQHRLPRPQPPPEQPRRPRHPRDPADQPEGPQVRRLRGHPP